jgi:hypothetical protein
MVAMIGGHYGFPMMRFLSNLKICLIKFCDPQNLGLAKKASQYFYYQASYGQLYVMEATIGGHLGFPMMQFLNNPVATPPSQWFRAPARLYAYQPLLG